MLSVRRARCRGLPTTSPSGTQPPRKFRVDGQTVRLDGYHRQPAHTVGILDGHGGEIILLVVPAQTGADDAHSVDDGRRRTGQHLDGRLLAREYAGIIERGGMNSPEFKAFNDFDMKDLQPQASISRRMLRRLEDVDNLATPGPRRAGRAAADGGPTVGANRRSRR